MYSPQSIPFVQLRVEILCLAPDMTHSANYNKNTIEKISLSFKSDRNCSSRLRNCPFSNAAGKLTAKSHKLVSLTKARRTSVLYKGTHWHCLVYKNKQANKEKQ